jgi:hypothetical protein
MPNTSTPDLPEPDTAEEPPEHVEKGRALRNLFDGTEHIEERDEAVEEDPEDATRH